MSFWFLGGGGKWTYISKYLSTLTLLFHLVFFRGGRDVAPRFDGEERTGVGVGEDAGGDGGGK